MIKLLISFFIVFNSFAAKEEKELRKIHLQNIKLKPRDSFLESQMTKIFIRDISRLLEREILVGKDLNYRKYSIQIESLNVKAVNKLGKYDIIVSYRNETSGKLINQVRRNSIRKQVLLQNIEQISLEIFTKAKLERDQITYVGGGKSKVNFNKVKQKNLKSEKLRKEIENNIKIKEEVVQKEIAAPNSRGNKLRIKASKIKNWEDALKKGKKLTIVLPPPAVEEKIPFYKELPEPPAPPAPKSLPPEPEPPAVVVKPKKKKKRRKKWKINFSMLGYYSSVTANDLFQDVKGGIPYIGLDLDFKLFKGNEFINDRFRFGYAQPLESIERQSQTVALGGDMKAGIGVDIRPFKRFLTLSPMIYYKKFSFVNAKNQNTAGTNVGGLERGDITNISGALDASVHHQFKKFWLSLGAINNLVFSSKQNYDPTREEIDFKESQIYLKIGKSALKNFKLYYEKNSFTGDNNPVLGNPFDYEAIRYGISYNFRADI